MYIFYNLVNTFFKEKFLQYWRSYEEIVVYTSLNNDSTLKEEEYKKCKPFILKGNPKKLLNYVDTIA